MLNKEVSRLLNEQINREFFSAYLYLEISNYFQEKNLAGFQNWYLIQAQEERDHALLFMTYLQNNNETVVLESIKAPNTSFADLKDPLNAAMAHEQYVTKLINDIYDAAYKEKDYRTMQFLDWFIKEQGEEEKSADDLCKKFELYGSDAKALYLLDAELGARTYTAPSLVL